MAMQVVDENNQWMGEKTMVVQVGYIRNRGREELKVNYMFDKLKQKAEKSGVKLVILNGNREIMNIEGNFRNKTSAAMEKFKRWAHSGKSKVGTHVLAQIFEGQIGSPTSWRDYLKPPFLLPSRKFKKSTLILLNVPLKS